MLWGVSRWFFSPLPRKKNRKGFFSRVHCEDQLELLEVKLMKAFCHAPQLHHQPHPDWVPWNFQPWDLSTPSLQHFGNYF